MYRLLSTEIGSYRRLQNNDIVLNPIIRRVNPEIFSGEPKICEPKLDLHMGKDQIEDKWNGEKIESILSYIMTMSPEKGKSLREVIKADFVSSRTTLYKILCSAYTKYKFEIEAIRWNGVIFLYVREGSYGEWRPNGLKFEQYMTLLEDGSVPDYNDPPSNAEQDKIVLRTTLSNQDTGASLNLFYGAAVNCIFDDKYCELKTVVELNDAWAGYASLRTYWQSILGTVPNIIFGFKKEKSELVEKIEMMPVKDIPNLPVVHWSPDEFLRRLSEVLEEIKRCLPADSNCLLIRFENGKYEYEEMPDNSFDLLTPKFIDHFTE